MIQIVPFTQFLPLEEALNMGDLPAELHPLTAALPFELLQLAALHKTAITEEQLPKLTEGLFVVEKDGQVIGYGSVEPLLDVPLTAGIALVKHCFIIPSERQKGYGSQLFRRLRQYARNHFGVLQLNENCPLYEGPGGLIDLD